MVFSSLTFLYAYLPIVLFIYYISPLQCRNVVLFIVSLIFYGWSNPLYICIMLFSIIMNYMFGHWIKTYQNKAKTFLILCIICNLSLLFFFKYYTFVNNMLQSSGIHILPALSIALPIGISFYTFQAMSYPIDLYTNTITPQKSLISFGTYVTMFPQLIAGPIVRYKDIASQLTQRKYTLDRFSYGIQRFVIGLSKKVMLANTCGEIYESIEALHFSQTSVCTSWIGILCYTFQIYFDFSGYSDMAIGNIIGSNLCNLLLILGLSATIKPVVFQKETRLYEIPMCLLVTIVLMYFCNSQGGISRLEAVILLVLFCAFIGYTIYMGRKESKKEHYPPIRNS
mgnify:CR=1 FL=1